MYVLIDKKISEIADEGIFSKVKTLPYRRFLLIQSRCFEDRAYSLVSNFVNNIKHKLRNFGQDWTQNGFLASLYTNYLAPKRLDDITA